MVRKQNERTLLLHSRIIPLSLPTKTLLLILAPCPLSTRLGAFSFPRNIFPQIFSEIFSNLPRWLFSVFLVRKIVALSKWLFFISLVRKIMGAKGSCRSPNGGGVSLFVCSPHSEWRPFYPTARVLFLLQSGQIFGKKGQKWNFICLAWCFLGIFGDQKRQKWNIFLLSGLSWCCFHPLLWWRWWCPLVAGGQASRVCRCSCGVFRPFVPAFCPFPAFPFLLCLSNVPYFAF